MAFRALPLFYGRVNKLALELFLELIMALQAELPLGLRLQSEFILPINQRECHDQAE